MKDDTISRAAAIDALDKVAEMFPYRIPGKAKTYRQYNEAWSDAIDAAENALEALPSAQPECEDAVSRFEVLRLIDYSSNDLNDSVDNRYFQGKVKELPSVTPKQPGWIPWDSGRFPEESGTYTVTAYDGATKRVTYAKYQKRLKRWELTGARAYWRVLAWQPLPTPYREGGQDGKN